MGIHKLAHLREDLVFFKELSVVYLNGSSSTFRVSSEEDARLLIESLDEDHQIAAYTLCNLIRPKNNLDERAVLPVYVEEYDMNDPARHILLTKDASVRLEVLIDTDDDPQYKMGKILVDVAELSNAEDALNSGIFAEIGNELVTKNTGKFRYVIDIALKYNKPNFDYLDADVDYSYQIVFTAKA